jgi:hypothetical protein
MRTIGDVCMRHGNLGKAREMWEAAQPLFKRSEQKKEVARIDERLHSLDVYEKLQEIPKLRLLTVPATLQDCCAHSEEKKLVLIEDR